MSRLSRRIRASGSSRPRTSSLARACWKASRPRSVRTSTLVQPSIDPTLPTERSARAAEEVGALVAALESRAVEVLHRLVHRQLAVAVLDDHAAPDHVDLGDPVEVDAAPVSQFAQHEALVVEALRAQKGDGEHDGVHPVGPGRPAAGLHGPEALDLARRAHHGEPGLRTKVVAGPGRARPGPSSGCRSCRRRRPARPGWWRRWPRPSTARRGRRSAWTPARRRSRRRPGARRAAPSPPRRPGRPRCARRSERRSARAPPRAHRPVARR